MTVGVSDNAVWVEQNFGECELGDKRRTARLKIMASNMLNCPDQSLPRQNGEWKDVKAAYRLFDNQQVTFEAVCDVHWKQTRNTAPGEFLLICDTSDIDQTRHKATSGLGMLGDGIGRGMQIHSCLMLDANAGQIVGIAGALLRNRSRSRDGETRMERLQRYRESQLWGDLVEEIGPPPAGCKWTYIFDRGGDNFEACLHLVNQGADWVIRVAKFQRNVIVDGGTRVPIKKALSHLRVLGEYELSLRSRPSAKARTVRLEVSVMSVIVPRPVHHSKWVKSTGITEVPMNIVRVRELNAPKGTTPIQWVLMTSWPVETFEQAWKVIEAYEHRWLIEEYHKVLKTGCGVERHSLRTADRLRPLIGLTSVIAIRLLQLKLIGRNQPDTKARGHVPVEWLRCLKLKYPRINMSTITIYDFFRYLAKLGGFLARRHDGEPGWQTIWRGYRRLMQWLEGIRLAGGFVARPSPPSW